MWATRKWCYSHSNQSFGRHDHHSPKPTSLKNRSATSLVEPIMYVLTGGWMPVRESNLWRSFEGREVDPVGRVSDVSDTEALIVDQIEWWELKVQVEAMVWWKGWINWDGPHLLRTDFVRTIWTVRIEHQSLCRNKRSVGRLARHSKAHHRGGTFCTFLSTTSMSVSSTPWDSIIASSISNQ